MGSIFFISFLAGLILNIFCVFLGSKIRSFRTRLEDGGYGISKLGGMAIVLSFFITIGIVFGRRGLFDHRSVVVLTALALTFLLGMFDDFVNLPPFKKLFAQFAIALFLVVGGIKTQIVFLSPLGNSLLTILWFVSLMNAFNFLDILDGLAAGISILCAATFLYICYGRSHGIVVILTAALLGSNLGFLGFNFHPARLYMGDTGSLFNGMALATIAIMISYAPQGREMALFVPFLIFALPLYDLIFVIVMRFARRKSIVKKSRDHFVLRLVDKGESPRRSVFLMYFFNILFNLMAILLLTSSNLFGFFILFLTLSTWLALAYKISKVNFREG